jgi:pseudaminic acid cytidylyltransferase
MGKIKRLLIVPARKESKRIKNKNIKFFYGKPIIYYPIKIALSSKLFSKIHISTDSEKILQVSRKYGITKDYLRPKNLSTDKADLYSVIKFAKKFFDEIFLFFDEYWVLLPCSPLLDKKDLINCSRIIRKNSKSVITVSPYSKPLNWALELKNNKLIPLKNIQNIRIAKKQYFHDSGQLYCFLKKDLDQKKFTFKNFYPYILPLEKSVDVDTPKEWEFMKKLFTLKK